MKPLLSASEFAVVIAALGIGGCAAPPLGTEAEGGSTALEINPSKSDTGSNTTNGKTTGRPSSKSPAPTGKASSSGATAASKFSCTAAGIAAYADALAVATQQACTDDGTGVVDNSDYACIKTAIDQVAPPHPDESYNIVTTLLAPNQQYPMLECTYFVQVVTAGVCGTPISPDDQAWTDYPLATEFAGKTAQGYTWIDNDGTQDAQAGDIFVYSGQGGQDPGHIMIVAEVVGDGQYRIAEANELNPDGSQAFDETGAVTNIRIATLDEPNFNGWFRLNAK
jgi:hypothetical protein